MKPNKERKFKILWICLSASFGVIATSVCLAQAPVLIDASGRVIGYELGGLQMTGTGYLFKVSPAGQIQSRIEAAGGGVFEDALVYFQPNCQGQSYLRGSPGNIGPGFIVSLPFNPEVLVYVRREQETFSTYSSIRRIGPTGQPECFNESSVPGSITSYETNDPAITGLSRSLFDEPLRYGVGNLSSCLLRDGFECEAVPAPTNGILKLKAKSSEG